MPNILRDFFDVFQQYFVVSVTFIGSSDLKMLCWNLDSTIVIVGGGTGSINGCSRILHQNRSMNHTKALEMVLRCVFFYRGTLWCPWRRWADCKRLSNHHTWSSRGNKRCGDNSNVCMDGKTKNAQGRSIQLHAFSIPSWTVCLLRKVNGRIKKRV